MLACLVQALEARCVREMGKEISWKLWLGWRMAAGGDSRQCWLMLLRAVVDGHFLRVENVRGG